MDIIPDRGEFKLPNDDRLEELSKLSLTDEKTSVVAKDIIENPPKPNSETLQGKKTSQISPEGLKEKLKTHIFAPLPDVRTLKKPYVDAAIGELKKTEETYHENLQKCVNELSALLSKFPKGKDIPKKEASIARIYYDQLCTYVHLPLFRLNEHSIKMLELLKVDVRAAYQYLTSISDDLSEFCADYNNIMSLVTNPPDISCLKQWSKELRAINFSDTFIRPIQRGPRYILLAQEIMKGYQKISETLTDPVEAGIAKEAAQAVATWISGAKLVVSIANETARTHP